MQQSNYRISIKIGLLVFLGLFLLLAGGFYIYRSLVQVVDSLAMGSPKQENLSTIKELTVSIDMAENDIRLYGITHQPKYLDAYRNRMNDIDTNLKQLSEQSPGDAWFVEKIHSIDTLISKKEALWDRLIVIWQQGATPAEISSITDELRRNTQSTAGAIDTVLIARPAIKPVVPKPVEPSIDTIQKGFFARLFSRSKERAPDEAQPKNQPSDSIATPPPDTSYIQQVPDQSSVIARLENLEKSERRFEQYLSYQEILLAEASNYLNESFMALITELEIHEEQKRQIHLQNAEKMADEAYQLLTILSVSALLLGIIVLWVFIQYLRKNKAYNQMLITSRKKTEELARSKEQFMANVSHEIRTPLNAITGFIKQLLAQPIPNEIRQKLQIVDSAGDQLIRLINDVLDFSKLQSGKLSIYNSHFKPDNLLKNICDLFSDRALENGNTIHLDTDDISDKVVLADAQRFQQIAYNLLSNAVKFTQNGWINVSANIVEENNTKFTMRLSISDNGLGIDTDKLPYIFEEYTQAENDTSIKYGGTGLGLSIVKKLVALFQGTISIESEIHQGTTVTCMLQFAPGDPLQIADTSEHQTKYGLAEGTRILIADDEAYNRSLMTMIFDKWNVGFDVARNGQECIDLLKQHGYQAVLMDLRMPIVDGVTATQYIRKQLNLSKAELPVICVTADITHQLDDDAKTLFNNFLIKPFTEEALYQALRGEASEEQTIDPIPMNEKPDEQPVATLKNLMHLAGNDFLFVEEMILQFQESTTESLKKIRTKIAIGQTDEIGDLAHQLCPAARHLGITKLVTILKNLELQSGTTNSMQLSQWVDEAEELMLVAMTELRIQYKELARQP